MNIEETIVKCLNNIGIIIGKSDIEKNTDLNEFITDSLTFVMFIIELEQNFEIEIPDEFLNPENIKNISLISDMINTIKSKKICTDAS